MNSYLSDIYARDEYAEDFYPQKLCNFLYQKYLVSRGVEKGVLLDIGSGKGNQLVGFGRNNFECFIRDRLRLLFDQSREGLDIFKSLWG